VSYRELSIIFAEITDNSITKKMAKLSIIDNDNFRYGGSRKRKDMQVMDNWAKNKIFHAPEVVD
jgi:hypothetical protein